MEDTARTADRDSGEGSQLRMINSLGWRQGQELARKARVLRQLGQDVLTALFRSGPIKNQYDAIALFDGVQPKYPPR